MNEIFFLGGLSKESVPSFTTCSITLSPTRYEQREEGEKTLIIISKLQLVVGRFDKKKINVQVHWDGVWFRLSRISKRAQVPQLASAK